MDVGNRFVRVIGNWENPGHPFVPESNPFWNIYLG
jgi:hypothetical protein